MTVKRKRRAFSPRSEVISLPIGASNVASNDASPLNWKPHGRKFATPRRGHVL